MQHTTIKSPDGLQIAVQEWGNPQGREILFIHGFNQCHLSWSRQFRDPALAEKFRMVTFDLRGHGSSGKPVNRDAYLADKLWGDDVATVIETTGLKGPVVVGWSYGGRVISDYLRNHGTAGVAAINYVGGRASSSGALFGPGRLHISGMTSPDLVTNIRSTRAFLRACFERQPDEEDFEIMLAFNMVVPAALRGYMMARETDDGAVLKKLTCPVLVTHGRSDQVILPAMAEFTHASIKGSKLSLYDGVGHSPFWEDAERFNRELAEFIQTVN
ncbi:MAG: alpha/beta fold hydrolase [Xanthobacteraceae bacterium]